MAEFGMSDFETAVRALEMIKQEIEAAPEGPARMAVVQNLLSSGRVSHAFDLLNKAIGDSPLAGNARPLIESVIAETKAAEALVKP